MRWSGWHVGFSSTGEEPARRRTVMVTRIMVRILREADLTSVAEAARKHSVTEQTIYRWRRLNDGMQVNDVKELKVYGTRTPG